MKKIFIKDDVFAIVDETLYEELSGKKWHLSKSGATFYAVRHKSPSTLGKERMHHLVIGYPPDGMVVDHKNGNGLDNRFENLRFVTTRENQQNQVLSTCKKHSKYPGVSRYVKGNFDKWVAGAKVNGKRKTIGYFDTEELAFIAYTDFINKKALA